MVNRTVQYANGSYFSIIPRALIDVLGLKPGDKVSFGIEDRKIIIAPVQTAQARTDAANTAKEVSAC